MFTICYKGFYIHGHFDRDECRVTELKQTFKSLRAAKCAITRAKKAAS